MTSVQEMRSLLERIPGRIRLWLGVAAAVIGLWLSVEMTQAMEPATAASEFGIVSLELAGTPERATEILDSWGAAGVAGARQAIRIDYGFLVAYGTLLALICAGIATSAGRRGWERTERLGWVLATSSAIAAFLDAIENTALLRVIDGYNTGDVGSAATAIAAGSAALKFAIIAVALLYIAVAGAAILWTRLSQPER